MIFDKLRAFLQLPPSRRRQYVLFQWARLVTATLHRRRLAALGPRTRVLAPLFWTPEFISLGANVLIWPGCRIEGVNSGARPPRITLEDGVTLQQNCHLTCAESLHVGEGTSVLAGATITDIDHLYETWGLAPAAQPLRVRATRIGRHCFIGTGALILAGTELGEHCIVGAHAVVRGVYPPGTVLAGAPARVIRQYDAATSEWRPPISSPPIP